MSTTHTLLVIYLALAVPMFFIIGAIFAKYDQPARKSDLSPLGLMAVLWLPMIAVSILALAVAGLIWVFGKLKLTPDLLVNTINRLGGVK